MTGSDNSEFGGDSPDRGHQSRPDGSDLRTEPDGGQKTDPVPTADSLSWLSRRGLLRLGAVGTAAVLPNWVSKSRFVSNSQALAGTATAESDMWTQQSKLVAEDGQEDDRFGSFVTLSADGSTALIGAPGAPNSAGVSAGAVYVFEENSNWSQQTKLTASDSPGFEFFGRQVALSADGSTAVIGAYNDIRGGDQSDRPGAAYVFTRGSEGWSQQTKLLAEDGDHLDNFGWSVAVSDAGETAVIGAHRDTAPDENSGSAYVFTQGSEGWSQQTKLVAEDGSAEDLFGDSVAVAGDGETAVIGAWFDDNSNGADAGSAYVFTRNEAGWDQETKLVADDGNPNEIFGGTVAVSSEGDTVMCSAQNTEMAGGNTYVFTRDGEEWTQQSKLYPTSDTDPLAFGGPAVSSDGDTTVIGASGDNDPNGSGSGSAFVFARDRFGNWCQQIEIAAGDGDAGDGFGNAGAVAADGNTAVVGAVNDEDPNGEDAGSAYVFTNPNGVRTGTVTFDNVGTSAWEVPSIECYGTETGGENPTLTLVAGIRYTITNDGYSTHPLAFRDAAGNDLLSQSDTGSFEDESPVDWIDNGQTVSFTLTSELASNLASYHCTVHGSMEGSIEIVGLGNSVSEYANDSGIVETDGLQRAIGDWRSGDIDTDLLRKVIDAWRSRKQVG